MYVCMYAPLTVENKHKNNKYCKPGTFQDRLERELITYDDKALFTLVDNNFKMIMFFHWNGGQLTYLIIFYIKCKKTIALVKR